MNAHLMVAQAFTDCLLKGVPLPFSVIGARYAKKTKKESIAQADVEMFDGEKAIVEVTKSTDAAWGWHIKWIKLSSDISYEGDRWVRISTH